MYYVYIIQSKSTNNIYIGSTKDLKARLERHNGGYVSSTKSGIPWKLLYYEAYQQKTQARRSEIFYKKAQGRRQLKKKLDL